MGRSELEQGVRTLESQINELHRRYKYSEEYQDNDKSVGGRVQEFVNAVSQTIGQNSIKEPSNGASDAIKGWKEKTIRSTATELLMGAQSLEEGVKNLEHTLGTLTFKTNIGEYGNTEATQSVYEEDVRDIGLALRTTRESIQNILVPILSSDQYIQDEFLNGHEPEDINFENHIKGNRDLKKNAEEINDSTNVVELLKDHYIEKEPFRDKVINRIAHAKLGKPFEAMNNRLVVNEEGVTRETRKELGKGLAEIDKVFRKEATSYVNTANEVMETLLESEYVPGERDSVTRMSSNIRSKLPDYDIMGKTRTAKRMLKNTPWNWVIGFVGGSLLLAYSHGEMRKDKSTFRNELYKKSQPVCNGAETINEIIPPHIDNEGFIMSQLSDHALSMPDEDIREVRVNHSQKAVPEFMIDTYNESLRRFEAAVQNDSMDPETFEEIYNSFIEEKRKVEQHTVFEDAIPPTEDVEITMNFENEGKIFSEENPHYPEDPIIRSVLYAEAVSGYLDEGEQVSTSSLNDTGEEIFLSTIEENDLTPDIGDVLDQQYKDNIYTPEENDIKAALLAKTTFIESYLKCTGEYSPERLQNELQKVYK